MMTENMSDHDMLVSIHTLSQEMWDAIYGNGQPGLLERVTETETKLEDHTATRKRDWLSAGGVATGMLAGIAVVGRLLGVA